MRTLKIAVAQFEPHDGDKAYNLSVIEANFEGLDATVLNIN